MDFISFKIILYENLNVYFITFSQNNYKKNSFLE